MAVDCNTEKGCTALQLLNKDVVDVVKDVRRNEVNIGKIFERLDKMMVSFLLSALNTLIQIGLAVFVYLVLKGGK
jgi:hypothetical protein